MFNRQVENSKRYVAEARYIMGEWRTVHSTTISTDSSYGMQCWVDDDGTSYGQIALNCVGVEVRNIREISEDEASAWEDEHC